MTIVTMAWLCAASAQPAQQNEAILARVGPRVITEAEFIRRFELTPGPRRQGRKLEEEKAVTLYSLLAEKLLADEARRQGLDKDSAAISALEGLRKILARDELYRVEVAQKVKVPTAEIEAEARRALRELRVEYLFFEDSTEAAILRRSIRRNRPLSAVVFDSSARALYDTVTVIWGDADPLIEDAAYRLEPGTLSPIVRAGSGFYILRLLQSAPNASYIGMQPSVLRDQVEQQIRLRMERRRLDEYLVEAMRGKSGYGRPAAIRRSAGALGSLAQSKRDSVVKLSPADLSFLYRSAANALLDTLAVAGARAWTVGDILTRLCGTGFSFPRMVPQADLGAKLSLQVRIWVQQELLEQEAITRRLDETPNVRPLLEMWTDSYLAGRMKGELSGATEVRDDEVWMALRAEDQSVALPRVRIETFWTRDLDRMHSAVDSLSAGMSFASVRAMFDESGPSPGEGRIEELTIGDRPPIGPIAWRMEVGRWYGPVRDRGGYLAFKLVEKVIPPSVRDSAFAQRAAAMHSSLAQMKKRGRLNYAIAALGKKAGFTVFEDRLAKIAVTRVPMVTYKAIGFGGRMFAVPFVDRQTEWLDVESPEPLP